jgi:hypothetical protein
MKKQMTLEQKYDRLERIARLLHRAALESTRKSRKEIRELRKRFGQPAERVAKH